MSRLPDVLWLSVSPSLKHFDQPLLRNLVQDLNIARWEYCQDEDEASSLNAAVVLLHDYLKTHDRPIHLIGHGLSGVVGLIYARRYPRRVRSLTLLAVAAQPATTWHSHYYVQRQLLPCSRQQLLAQTVRSLFGKQPPYAVKDLVNALNRDLEESPSMHSLYKLSSLARGGVSVPLLICGSKTDPIVDPMALAEWLPWLKPEDVFHECVDGRHFFHYFHPKTIGELVVDFLRSQDAIPSRAPYQLHG